MHVPGARERVSRRGQSGLFLVVSTDQERCVANLLALADGIPRLEESVPFEELEPGGDGSLFDDSTT